MAVTTATMVLYVSIIYPIDLNFRAPGSVFFLLFFLLFFSFFDDGVYS